MGSGASAQYPQASQFIIDFISKNQILPDDYERYNKYYDKLVESGCLTEDEIHQTLLNRLRADRRKKAVHSAPVPSLHSANEHTDHGEHVDHADHMAAEIHEKKFRCETCDISFTAQDMLDKHFKYSKFHAHDNHSPLERAKRPGESSDIFEKHGKHESFHDGHTFHHIGPSQLHKQPSVQLNEKELLNIFEGHHGAQHAGNHGINHPPTAAIDGALRKQPSIRSMLGGLDIIPSHHHPADSHHLSEGHHHKTESNNQHHHLVDSHHHQQHHGFSNSVASSSDLHALHRLDSNHHGLQHSISEVHDHAHHLDRRPSTLIERKASNDRSDGGDGSRTPTNNIHIARNVYDTRTRKVTSMPMVYCELERTSKLLQGYYDKHQRLFRATSTDGCIFSGSQYVRWSEASGEYVDIYMYLIDAPSGVVVDTSKIVEIVVSNQDGGVFGKCYLSYNAMMDMLDIRISKAIEEQFQSVQTDKSSVRIDSSTEHMIMVQYLLYRVSLNIVDGIHVVYIRHDVYDAADNIEKKLNHFLEQHHPQHHQSPSQNHVDISSMILSN